MIKSFRCDDTRRLFEGHRVKRFTNIESVARRKLEMLAGAQNINDLRNPPNNRLKQLKDDRKGQYSIRINDQFRLCFVWDDGAEYVEIVDYH